MIGGPGVHIERVHIHDSTILGGDTAVSIHGGELKDIDVSGTVAIGARIGVSIIADEARGVGVRRTMHLANPKDCHAPPTTSRICSTVEVSKLGCNDPCVCGSGLKWKKCCGR